MGWRDRSLTWTLRCSINIRHTLRLDGIDDEMWEFGQGGIKYYERELLSAPADDIDTLLTMLKLRDDWRGSEMARHLQWILLKAETRERGIIVPVLK